MDNQDCFAQDDKNLAAWDNFCSQFLLETPEDTAATQQPTDPLRTEAAML